jgi:hypothetical protein
MGVQPGRADAGGLIKRKIAERPWIEIAQAFASFAVQTNNAEIMKDRNMSATHRKP